MEVDSQISTIIREVFQDEHDALVNQESRKILVSHYGTFSQDLVGSLSNSVEELMISIGDKRIVIKRMFSILLEGLQNIRMHGGEDEFQKQLGFLLIGTSDENYKVIMANIVDAVEEPKMGNYIDEINALSDAELKDKYINVLSNEFMSNKGGAGLGFITTRMKSGALGYRFDHLGNEKSLFSLIITLPRIKR